MSPTTGPQVAMVRVLQTVGFIWDHMRAYEKYQRQLCSARIHIDYAFTHNTAPHQCVCECCQVRAAVSPKRTAIMERRPGGAWAF